MPYSRAREMEPRPTSYEEAVANFRWHVPEKFNIAQDVCTRYAQDAQHRQKTALIYESASGEVSNFSFGQLEDLSSRLATVLTQAGPSTSRLVRGDRLAVLMPQRLETALTHLAAYRLGLIAVPLTVLFRREALVYRLHHSGAKGIVTEPDCLPLLEEILPQLPDLKLVIVGHSGPAVVPSQLGAGVTCLDLWTALQQAQPGPAPAQTGPDDPAMIIYTSGTTGNPKGALQAHRYLIGHLPGFELSHNFTPQPGDCFWTPADWAWVGGLLDILLTAWHYGLPVLSYRAQGAFDPERACRMMEKHGVRNAFIPPTALKMMAQIPALGSKYRLQLRSLMSGGEALGASTLRWAEQELRVQVNEIYGQTEINYCVGNCAPLYPVHPGSMGRPFPGHQLAVLGTDGQPRAVGEQGELAVLRQGDPVFFLEYWNNPTGTQEKFVGDWALTGDLAVQDDQGYLWFKGRADDVIITAGHRIGPTEIEGVVQGHFAVALNAVVASPDALRGDIIKAFIKLKPEYQPSEDLKRDIQQYVKDNLARHEYPREIEFIDEFPLTTTGKIMRRELRQRELSHKQRQT